MTAAALLRSAAQLTQQRTRQRGRIWLVSDLLCLHAILSQNILHVASALPPSRLLLRPAAMESENMSEMHFSTLTLTEEIKTMDYVTPILHITYNNHEDTHMGTTRVSVR